ncbi:MAG: hypothetical protein JW889_10550 [Verrucomicrobia bacterium]|nr:hypothetical protein [Verrucomicrobiota bacterium]
MRAIVWAVLVAAVLVWGLPALAGEETGEDEQIDEPLKEQADEAAEESAEETAEELAEESVEGSAEETAEEQAEEQTEPATVEQMDDAQGRGYAAAADGKPDKAASWFQKAAAYADRLASWEGLMDASLALSSVGDTKAAKSFLDKANALSATFKDWRTSLAMSHAYASLPDEAEADDDAEAAVNEAKELATDLESWRAMLEVGSAYLNLKLDKAKAYAVDAYDTAYKIAADLKDAEGLEQLAMRFDEVGEEVKAAEAREMIKQIPEKQRKKKARPAPPRGWSATGSSLAEPREISEQSKAILAQRAALKHIEALEKAREAGAIDDQTYYVYEYNRYWASHPDLFRNRFWDRDDDFHVDTWGKHHLGDYRLEDGAFVRIISGD